MANPLFIEEESLSLVGIQKELKKIEKRDKELNYLSNKVKEYLETFAKLSEEQNDELEKKLVSLKLTRLKNEHIAKVIDFLPSTINELKVILQAYPLSLPKKDQESIIKVVREVIS